MDYFGTAVTEANLEDLLRTAVDHTPVTTNRDLAFDPDAWASGLLDQLACTPATAAALDEVLAHPATAKRAGDVRW